MNCTNCGNALRPGDQFCLKCGGPAPPSNMEPSGAPVSQPPQQPPQSHPQQSVLATPSQPAQSAPPHTSQAPHSQPARGYPPQQPQAYPPSDAQSQARTLLGLAMVFSLIGGIMLMILEFGGWYNYNDYYHTREWGWVGPLENPLSFLPFLAVAGSLFYCSFTAYQGFSSKVGLKRSLIMRGFVISLIVFIVVIVGGATLIALTWDNDSQWLSAGFYGGAIGSFLTAILFWLVLKNIPHTKIDKRAGFGAQPYGAQYPYQQTQAPQATGPSPQPQAETSQEPQVTGDTAGEDEQTTQEEEQKSQEEPQPETQEPAREEPEQEPLKESQPVQINDQQPQQQPQTQQQQYPQQYQQPYYPQYQQQPQKQTYPCRTCGRPLRYVAEYRRWYCDTCRQYV